jgi:short-subunit dehydrogenase
MALAEQFAPGARVLGIGRRALPTALSAHVTQDDYCAVDLGSPEAAYAVRSFMDARGVETLDILIHNAALGWYGPIPAQTPASIDELLNVNLYAPIALSHALLDRVRAARGVIAFISSVHSTLPTPDFAVYTATKAAIDAFARNLRVEERGAVDVVVIWPGPTRTQMHAKAGMPPDRIRSERYPTPKAVAAQAAAAVERRQSRALGAGSRMLRAISIHARPLVDSLLLAGAGRSLRAGPGREALNNRPPGKHAVVTGAAEGIGRALMERFALGGYALTGIDVNAALSAQTQQDLARSGAKVAFLHCDLSNRADLHRTAASLAGGAAIDLLVHNAGINHVAPFGRSELDRQRAVLDVNLRAPLHLTAALLRGDTLAPGATIVFISSLSHFVSYPGAAVYAASKDGLASYARSLSVALQPEGIRVLVVYPGPTRTTHARRHSPDNRRENKRMPPEQVAHAIDLAVEHKRRTLIPGFGNRTLALLGHWAPRLVEWWMRNAILRKL